MRLGSRIVGPSRMKTIDPERNRQRAREWYYANHERARAAQRAYASTRRDEKRAYDKTYRTANLERRLAQDRAYYLSVGKARRAADPTYAARQRAANAAYRPTHREVFRHHQALRVAREANAPGTHTIEQWIEKCELFAWCCAYCGEATPLVREHRIPLTRGGSNDIANIVPACRSCNSQKRQMTDREFLAARSLH